MFVVKGFRQRVRVRLIDEASTGVPTVAIPPGEHRVQTQVFLTSAAERARAVGLCQPRNAHAVAHREPVNSGAECLDPAHDLVPWNHAWSARWQVTLGKVQVGATDAAAGNGDAKLSGSGFRTRALDTSEWTFVDRTRVIDGPGPHNVTLPG
jgi:hypothetical protein